MNVMIEIYDRSCNIDCISDHALDERAWLGHARSRLHPLIRPLRHTRPDARLRPDLHLELSPLACELSLHSRGGSCHGVHSEPPQRMYAAVPYYASRLARHAFWGPGPFFDGICGISVSGFRRRDSRDGTESRGRHPDGLERGISAAREHDHLRRSFCCRQAA